jgi:hypothetical protein
VISLPEAIEKVRSIYQQQGKAAFDDEVAVKLMGYKSLSGASRSVLGALRAYGLLKGKGDSLTVSDEALTIIVDENADDQSERAEALTAAIRHNKVFDELFSRFSDEGSVLSISSYLQKNYNFKPQVAQKVAQNYKDSVAIVDVIDEGYDEGDDEDNPPPPPEVKVGDRVQWTAKGVDQFPDPRRVRAIDQTGEWVFVEQSETGIPMNEISVVERGIDQTGINPPTLKIDTGGLGEEEKEFSRGALSGSVDYRLLISGDLGPREIGKLIKLLEAQKAVLSDDDEEL